MSNRAYLTACDHDRIYPWFGDLEFDPARDVALACDGCIPLLWMCSFSASDLKRRSFEVHGHEVSATAPLAERVVAIQRLESRRPLLNRWFERNGGLDPHVDAFARHLRELPGRHLSIELEEIEALHGQYDVPDILRLSLERLDAGDESCLDLLIPLSTVLENRAFPPLGSVGPSSDQEDRWNVYRLLGGSWLQGTPWDHVDEDPELTRTLNARRPRAPFELRLPA